MNVVTSFILQVVEACIRSTAAAGLTYLGGGAFNLYTTNWHDLGGFMAGAFIITLLSCLATQPIGDKTTPSMFSHAYTFVPVPDVTKTVTVNSPQTTTIVTPPGTQPSATPQQLPLTMPTPNIDETKL